MAIYKSIFQGIFTAIVISGITNDTLAQSSSADTAKCYATCRVPYQYRIDSIKVVDKPTYKMTVTVPASFEVSESVLGYASGDTVEKHIPAIYDVQEVNVPLSSGKSESVRYKAVTQYVVLQEAQTKRIPNVVKQKAVTVYTQSEASKKKKIQIPATYTYVVTKTLTSGKNETITAEILCPDKLTPKLIKQVHDHLNMLGYPTDNIPDMLGQPTLDSLEKYQQDNQLPVGGLNIPTLELLNLYPTQ